MSVNLSKNGAALMAAYKEVVDGKSNTDWALFTYEGNTNDLRVAQKGDGGLEEMVEELNSGKVMYAFCRVRDPNSGLPKYVLINWTGEGVKDSRKGQCANHVRTIADFLKGSVYRKVNAVEEIQQINKDDFWVKAQRDEEMRQKEENIRAEQERQKAERERRDMEERQSKERERIARERAQQIEQEKLRQKQREDEEREQEQQRRNEQLENRKMTGISAAASVQKANEAKSLISQRAFNPRDIFKQKEQSFDAGDTPAASRPGRLQSPFPSQKSFERDVPVQPRFPPSSPPAVTPLSPITSALPVMPVSPVAAASTTAPESAHSPVQPADTGAGYGDEDEWSDDFDEDEAAQEGSPAQDDPYMAPHSAGSNEDLYQNVSQHAPAANSINWDGSGQGICARALYDYQAADDTEITFDPDDIITQIEMLDEGWWRGYGPNGEYGMFPANYVELI